jgi:hypothetical protein
VATTQRIGTVTNVEVGTFDFTAAGTLNVLNASYATLNVTSATGIAADVDNIASGINVDIEDTHITSVALDYVTDAVANIDLGSGVSITTFAVTDAKTVNWAAVALRIARLLQPQLLTLRILRL